MSVVKPAGIVSSWGVETVTCLKVALVTEGQRDVSRTRSMSNTLAVAKGESQGNSVWDSVSYSSDAICNGGGSSL